MVLHYLYNWVEYSSSISIKSNKLYMKTSLFAIALVIVFALGLSYKPNPTDKSEYTDTTDWQGWKNKHSYKPWD
jgi:uncharacterized sodium:solute symporter family permease YidK